MSNDINSFPKLSAPIDLTQLTETQLRDEAAAIAKHTPLFTEDQIVDQLTFLKDNGILLEQKNIDNLLAGEPVLTPPDVADFVFPKLALEVGTDTNYWLSPNPLVTFMVTYLDLAAQLSREKVMEAQILIDSLNVMYELSKDTADLIRAAAEAERAMHIASAVAGAITAVFSVASFARATHLRKKDGMDEGTIMANTQMIGQGGAALGTIMEKAMHAHYTLVKGEAEADKTMVEATLKIIQRRMDSAADTYRAVDEVMQQFLQNLQKLIDESLKAHGFQVH